MKEFDAYAEYYDLLYEDKDYAAETTYIRSLLNRSDVQGGAILDLGCGTGGHALPLAEAGFTVHGVDRSRPMLEIAKRKLLPIDASQLARRITYEEADIRAFECRRPFDAVVALFHVISYQTADEDLIKVFTGVRKGLRKDGVFIFDFWHGPGVMNDPPYNRIKEIGNDRIKVRREAMPVLDSDCNIVNIQFNILVKDLASGIEHTFMETHCLRYFFPPELFALLGSCGFSVLNMFSWKRFTHPGPESWYACVVVRRDYE